MDNLFGKVDQLLEEDLIWFDLIRSEVNKDTAETKRKHKDFIKYLVSVATHPIGLRASLEPFNSCQEHMLALIMEMFRLSEGKLKKMLIVDENAGGTNQQKTSRAIVKSAPVAVRKRHPWRPELRIRINPPTFFYHSKDYLSNLFVRVYLFKEESGVSEEIGANQDREVASNQTDTGSKGLLNKIFRRFKLSQSKLIRPVNEMRHLLRFKNRYRGSVNTIGARSMYTMVQLLGSGKTVAEDIYIHMRRYYCDPKTHHMLRFEFWLDTQHTRLSFLNRYRRYIRRLVYNGCLTCCFTWKKSIYMNEKQEFYGYTNIMISQLPSYPIKQNYPILTLYDRQVNSCEICFDIKNRRIQEGVNIKEDISENIHLINHIRLYASIIVYHCLTLGQLDHDSFAKKEIYQNVALENILYLPAYSLLNQHRLQINLNQLVDQSIKRITFLLLLMKIHKQSTSSKDENQSRLEGLMTILISVLQNEYMLVRRDINARTLQETDPFRDSSSKSDVLDLELATLQRFIKQFLRVRLRGWLSQTGMKRSTQDLELSVTLNSLRMFKSAISNLSRCCKARRLAAQQSNISNLKISVNQLLCEIIFKNLAADIESIAYPRIKSPKRTRVKNSFIRPILANQNGDSQWAQLLHKINCINRNLSLYWSRSGLDGLILREQEFIIKLDIFHELEKRNFRSILVEKIDNYLK